jgi:hypothetical protein
MTGHAQMYKHATRLSRGHPYDSGAAGLRCTRRMRSHQRDAPLSRMPMLNGKSNIARGKQDGHASVCHGWTQWPAQAGRCTGRCAPPWYFGNGSDALSRKETPQHDDQHRAYDQHYASMSEAMLDCPIPPLYKELTARSPCNAPSDEVTATTDARCTTSLSVRFFRFARRPHDG